MTSPLPGGVDCDLHPAVPHLTSLLPYMNDYWRDQVTTRGMTDLVSQSYPTNSPISSRPDWRPAQGKPGSDLADMQKQALDRFGTAYGICNPLVRRADGVLRGHAGRVLPRAERLAGQGMARQGCAAARLDRDPDAKRRKIRRRDRALRQGQALRPGADAGHGRHAAWQARLLADLCGGRTAGPGHRHPRRQRLSQPADLGRLGLLPHRGLCRAGHRVPDPAHQPDRGGRVRPPPEV